MSFAEVMQFLADYYIYGISVLSVILITLYLVFSIRLIITSRREDMDVCVSAMIPVYNIVLWVRKCIKKKKNHMEIAEDEEIEL